MADLHNYECVFTIINMINYSAGNFFKFYLTSVVFHEHNIYMFYTSDKENHIPNVISGGGQSTMKDSAL